jgi:alpha-L-fucosidase 2
LKYHAEFVQHLNLAAKKSYKSLREAHIADYQKYFQRVSLQLEPLDPAAVEKPVLERLKNAENGPGDPNLAAWHFNFGRYLLISSSRPGGLPPNLQGIWAEEIHTPWNGDWHLDVNVQVNYWPAEVCNLSDWTPPLFALISSLQEPGAKTAHDCYNARGWVAHVIANPWGFTSAKGRVQRRFGLAVPAFMGSLSVHPGSEIFARAYLIMKGSAQQESYALAWAAS